MKSFFSVLMLLFTFVGQAQEKVVLYNANLVDVEKGTIVPSTTVTMHNGIITNIEPAKKRMKRGDIDLTGKYLMPGMIDSHLHWGNFAEERPDMDSLCAAYIRQGVTTVRDVGGDAPVLKKYHDYLDKGLLRGPSVYYCSFWAGEGYFDLIGKYNEIDVNVPWNLQIKPGDDYRKAIREAKECGCIGLKLYADISYEQLCEIVKICKEENMLIWGHLATNQDNALEVVKAGVEVVSHVYYVLEMTKGKESEAAKLREGLFQEMVKRGTVLDPSLTNSIEGGMQGNCINDFSEAYKRGVKFVAGTDFINISKDKIYTCYFLNELNLYVDKCGVSVIDALRAATMNGAEIIGMKDKLGVIKRGAEADLLVLKDNPLLSLKALENIETIYINGK